MQARDAVLGSHPEIAAAVVRDCLGEAADRVVGEPVLAVEQERGQDRPRRGEVLEAQQAAARADPEGRPPVLSAREQRGVDSMAAQGLDGSTALLRAAREAALRAGPEDAAPFLDHLDQHPHLAVRDAGPLIEVPPPAVLPAQHAAVLRAEPGAAVLGMHDRPDGDRRSCMRDLEGAPGPPVVADRPGRRARPEIAPGIHGQARRDRLEIVLPGENAEGKPTAGLGGEGARA